MNESIKQQIIGYLCVDSFIHTMVGVQALKSAFQLNVIDCLQDGGVTTFNALVDTLKADRPGLRVLCDLLIAENILIEYEGGITISHGFMEALRYRDLIEAKIDFADIVAPDLMDHFTAMINDPDVFMERARVFALFDYRRCFERTQANYESTKRWMRFTTALTKYEAGVCAHYHDFSVYEHMLDIGGNSGEFVLQLCKRHMGLNAKVFDLPLVCDIGQEHIIDEVEKDRIEFIHGDALEDQLPTGLDLVSFKSMLHDWPEELAQRFIAQSYRSLRPGGTILIFERGPMSLKHESLGYSSIPMLLFFRSFRSASVYERLLEMVGFTNISIKEIDLDTPFILITARKV